MVNEKRPANVEHKTRHVSALVNTSAVVGGVVAFVVVHMKTSCRLSDYLHITTGMCVYMYMQLLIVCQCTHIVSYTCSAASSPLKSRFVISL